MRCELRHQWELNTVKPTWGCANGTVGVNLMSPGGFQQICGKTLQWHLTEGIQGHRNHWDCWTEGDNEQLLMAVLMAAVHGPEGSSEEGGRQIEWGSFQGNGILGTFLIYSDCAAPYSLIFISVGLSVGLHLHVIIWPVRWTVRPDAAF